MRAHDLIIITGARRVLAEGSGSWDDTSDSESGSWDDDTNATNATNATYIIQEDDDQVTEHVGPYYTPWENYELTVITYVTDKYKAESRREAQVIVSPAVLDEGDGAAAPRGPGHYG